MEWPQPQNIKALRGFLGLIGYYGKFIKGYGLIAKPLTTMLKKNSFIWTQEAIDAFYKLKSCPIGPPILSMPYFSKDFIIDMMHVVMEYVRYFYKTTSLLHILVNLYKEEIYFYLPMKKNC